MTFLEILKHAITKRAWQFALLLLFDVGYVVLGMSLFGANHVGFIVGPAILINFLFFRGLARGR